MRISDWSSDVCSSDLQDRRRGTVARIVACAILARAPRHQRGALRDAIGDQRFVMRLVEQMIGLARDDKFDRSQVGALMEKLEHRLLRVGADAAPGDRRGLLSQRLAGAGNRLAVRFHLELLEVEIGRVSGGDRGWRYVLISG